MMAPDADIYDYRVFKEVRNNPEDSSMSGRSETEIGKEKYGDNLIKKAIEHAINEGVDIINMSLTRKSPSSPAYTQAIEDAVKAGIIVVCAAGGGDGNPATREK